MLDQWRQRAKTLEREVYVLYLACRDSRAPWYAKALALAVVAYAFSPIDLIPDFIPVLGLVDDLLILPMGVLAVRSMVPPEVMSECRDRAQQLAEKPKSWTAAAVIIAIWVAIIVAAIRYLQTRFRA